MDTIKAFFSKIRALFLIFKKGQGRPHPHPPPSPLVVSLITSERKQKEKECMLSLQTVFPYRLNGCLGNDFIKEDTHFLVGSKFPALLRQSVRM